MDFEIQNKMKLLAKAKIFEPKQDRKSKTSRKTIKT